MLHGLVFIDRNYFFAHPFSNQHVYALPIIPTTAPDGPVKYGTISRGGGMAGVFSFIEV
jgi:hypothetical protein